MMIHEGLPSKLLGRVKVDLAQANAGQTNSRSTTLP